MLLLLLLLLPTRLALTGKPRALLSASLRLTARSMRRLLSHGFSSQTLLKLVTLAAEELLFKLALEELHPPPMVGTRWVLAPLLRS